MYSSSTFGRIFWVDDDYEFKSCPLCVDGTGDFDQEDYVSEWTDWEGVNMEILFNIYRCELINKVEYGGSLTHKETEVPIPDNTLITKNDPINITQFQEELEIKKYIKETENEPVMRTYDEDLYKEIVKDSEFSYGKFNENNYPLHLQQH